MIAGDKIKMTPEALKQGLDGLYLRIRTGIFLGPASKNHKDCIRVRRDGRKVTEVYHKSFWEAA